MGLLERRRLLLQNAANRALNGKSAAPVRTENEVLEVGDQTIFNPTGEQLRAAGYVPEEEIPQNF